MGSMTTGSMTTGSGTTGSGTTGSMTTQAVRHDSMRARNLAVVLGEVRRSGPVTRAALAEITGLTKTTVSKMVGDLLEAGMVAESAAPRDGERGRPGTAVSLSGDRVAALGLEITAGHLSACVADLTLTVRLRCAQAVDNRSRPPVETMAHLQELAHRAVDEARTAGLSVVGSTLAVPGPVDGGLLHTAPNLGWRGVRAGDLLDFPVTVENEANLAALGELWFGGGPGDFLHVSGETGIGAGLVVGGELFRGAHGLAGELGHVVVFPDGPDCRCGGRGCLERYAGQEALLRASGAAGVPELTELLRAGEADALRACERAGRALGVALTSAVNLMDPGTVVLGGIFAPLFEWVAGPVREAMSTRLAGMRRSVPELAVSRLGGDAATLGGAGRVIHRVIADPAPHLPTARPAVP
ncbi:sugar kinase [Streptosporangium pseudovulgare]|uniref:Sugar kinase n=2 Tax=Streptosporangium pseudovulgare TaxID=35765 RepID=A0ABQ2R7K4_9ACTN|nr:sugar kinase [Streptosporangium pseudovulgare]